MKHGILSNEAACILPPNLVYWRKYECDEIRNQFVYCILFTEVNPMWILIGFKFVDEVVLYKYV